MSSESLPQEIAGDEHHFCTLFDSVYLTRGIALYRSLMRSTAAVRLTAMCLDAKSHDILDRLALPGLELVTVEELERWEPRLREARSSRKPVEFYFTCKPVLMMSVVEKNSAARRITYLDSDLYYFSDPVAFEAGHDRSSVALTPHRFSPGLESRIRYGKFNAGWVSVGCDAEGKRFMGWWRERCLEWCKLDAEEDRFADQKYLDRVPGLFSGVECIGSPGANLAPWNIRHLRIGASGGSVTVDGEPVSFFHFHGLRRMMAGTYDTGLRAYGVPLHDEVRKFLYRPYLEEIKRARQFVANATGERLDTQPEYAPDNALRRHLHMMRLLLTNTWMAAS